MNREIDKTLSADWIRSEANVWKGIFMKSDMGIGVVKGLGGGTAYQRLPPVAPETPTHAARHKPVVGVAHNYYS